MAGNAFWNDQEAAKLTISRLKQIKPLVDIFHSCRQDIVQIKEIMEIVEDDDVASLKEIGADCAKLTKKVQELEFQRLYADPDDAGNAIISINAGAGGTEACDWTEMLFRMLQRYCERKEFAVEILDFLPGEEAGVKNVAMYVKGPYAFGKLRSESGVHRLVRISPFDSAKRRHTSFSSVDVIAEAAPEVEIEINEEDLRIDTFRAGGAGGQHVNKTESAIRITHLPTGIVVQCQNERSQHKNKATGMKILKARLHDKQKREEDEERSQRYGEKKKIEWGSQIRSYVFHPYTMVKDLRTGCETSNGQAVMDGDIDEFIETFLRWKLENS